MKLRKEGSPPVWKPSDFGGRRVNIYLIKVGINKEVPTPLSLVDVRDYPEWIHWLNLNLIT